MMSCLCFARGSPFTLEFFERERERVKREDMIVECPLAKILTKEDLSDLLEIARLLPDEFIEDSIRKSKVPEYKVIRSRFNRFKKTII